MEFDFDSIPPAAAVDLHIHTIDSDGHWQPTELFNYLAGHRFRLVSVTDHDRLDTVDEMRRLGAERGVAVLPGVEITTNWRGLSAHILCYASAFRGGRLATLARGTYEGQLQNTRSVYDELMRAGHEFPRQAEVLASQEGSVVRPIDNARLLYEHGYAPSMDAALERIREAGYRSLSVPIAVAIEAAHADGGIAVLAHPGRGGGELQQYDRQLLQDLVSDVPLDGIEAHYPTHTPEQIEQYTEFAAAHGLVVSAGSDSHGPNQRYPIPYLASLCEGLLNRLGINVEAREDMDLFDTEDTDANESVADVE